MLKFPCHCGHQFALDDEEAGRSVQCPQCGRLNDVPTLSDLKNIAADGTYLMDIAPIEADNPETLRGMRQAFSKDKFDEEGTEIDLRPTGDDVRKAGISDQEFWDSRESNTGILKYDPVTGELIRPLEIRQDPKAVLPEAIPMASRTLNYASPEIRKVRIGAASIFVELFKPTNLAVMFFVLIGHFVLLFMFSTCIMGIGSVVLLFAIVAHYAIIVEETGPNDQDELPRPLRQANWAEDIWGPFTHSFLAFAYCFGPSIVMLLVLPRHYRLLAALLYFVYGLAMFPAAFLTTTTSGTIINLRPDRLLGVIRAVGIHYLWSLAVFVPAVAIYWIGIGAVIFNLLESLSFSSGNVAAWFAYPTLVIGVYLMHYFCWHLGRLWRSYHRDFPWVMQFHDRPSRVERTATMYAKAAERRAAIEANQTDPQWHGRL